MSREFQQIERVEGLTPERFHRDYVAQRRPVILNGLAASWPAVGRWTPEHFRREFRGLKIRIEVWRDDNGVNDPLHFMQNLSYAHTTLGSFVDKLLASDRPTREYYLAQFPLLRALPQLHDDIQSLESLMVQPRFVPEPVRRRLQIAPAFWLGPAGSVSPMHFDPVDNLFVQVYGSKRVILVSPQQSAALYYPHERFKSMNFTPVDIERPDLRRFPRARELAPLQCDVRPGDVLYIPMGWWHYLRATHTSISLNFWWAYWRHLPAISAYYSQRWLRDLRQHLGLIETISVRPKSTAAALEPEGG